MPSNQPTSTLSSPVRCLIHLLDVGSDKYGDCFVCQLGDKTILIDGAHPADSLPRAGHRSIPQQLQDLLGPPPFKFDLLVVTHAHSDHIGCLPKLVGDAHIEATWALLADPLLGWGRSTAPDFGGLRDEADVLSSALREEDRADVRAEALDRFFSDVVNLEGNYHAMIDKLREAGTSVVLYGRDDPTELEGAFSESGFSILGPTQSHLEICAAAIREAGRDGLDANSRQLASSDLIAAYRALAGSDAGGTGAAINNQSLVLRFNFHGRKLLFTGDMQFVSPGVPGLKDEMAALFQKVGQEGPWSFVKIGHHASSNALNEAFLTAMGKTPFYGISTGEHSSSHPSPSVLALLKRFSKDIKWARTDHNRKVTFDFSGAKPNVSCELGSLNDAEPNPRDEVEAKPLPAPPTQPEESSSSPSQSTSPQPIAQFQNRISSGETVVTATTAPTEQEWIEVTARVPNTATRVTLTIDVQPNSVTSKGDTVIKEPPNPSSRDSIQPPRLGAGRVLPPLLFVTDREALARNIGQLECDAVLRALSARPHFLVDTLSQPADVYRAAQQVRSVLAANDSIRGVVIVGGYDVVPPLRLDVLPPALRSQLGQNQDPDNFVVWSDSIYGDVRDDQDLGSYGLADLPVSRIPDGKSADLVYAALEASEPPAPVGKCGVRNVQRPFADTVYDVVPGTQSLRCSAPLMFNQNPPYLLDGGRTYLMLHGDWRDGSRFWGEDVPGTIEAVNLSNLPSNFQGVVFTGCCWGALISEKPAARIKPGEPVALKTSESSLALAFLRRGAQAFIGCTGVHYSPVEPPFDYFGGPLHKAFWQAHRDGKMPAEALLAAKLEFLTGMPHGQTSPASQAIEHKILRQYTCLGLGW